MLHLECHRQRAPLLSPTKHGSFLNPERTHTPKLHACGVLGQKQQAESARDVGPLQILISQSVIPGRPYCRNMSSQERIIVSVPFPIPWRALQRRPHHPTMRQPHQHPSTPLNCIISPQLTITRLGLRNSGTVQIICSLFPAVLRGGTEVGRSAFFHPSQRKASRCGVRVLHTCRAVRALCICGPPGRGPASAGFGWVGGWCGQRPASSLHMQPPVVCSPRERSGEVGNLMLVNSVPHGEQETRAWT